MTPGSYLRRQDVQSPSSLAQRVPSRLLGLMALFLLCTASAFGLPAWIEVDGLRIRMDLDHAGPAGDLIEPAIPGAQGFGPPTIFSAPMPSGSGARALGFAGAFTAVADDATAASWNPGGLWLLSRTPEHPRSATRVFEWFGNAGGEIFRS